jgi:hypothetical protein
MRVHLALGIILATCAFIGLSCSKSEDSPRERVLAFVRTVQADSLPDIAQYLDLDSVATYEYPSEKFKELSPQEKRNRLIDGFLRDGEYRRTWSRSQIVVNEEALRDDTTATVEVSFIDRATRIQYYSQMGLKKRNANWLICSFKIN